MPGRKSTVARECWSFEFPLIIRILFRQFYRGIQTRQFDQAGAVGLEGEIKERNSVFLLMNRTLG